MQDPAETCTALAIHSDAACFTDPLKLPERLLTIGHHEIVIQQAYLADGKGGSQLGFGASVYPAAIVLSTWLHDALVYGSAACPDLARRLRAGTLVELGAGTGLVSAVAARAGSPSVCCTDGDAALLAQLTLPNIQRIVAASPEPCCRPQVLPWLWGHRQHARTVLAHAAAAATPTGSIAAIVAADVVAVPYAEALAALLTDLRGMCLAAASMDGSGVPPPVLIAYTRRHHSEDTWWTEAARWFRATALDVAACAPEFADRVRLVRLDMHVSP